MGTTRITAPVALASICHGTMLLWCSIVVRTISSPAFTFARPHVWATRLIASVVPRVKTISFSLAAPRKRRTRSRAASNASVASWERRWTPRCTFAFVSR